MLLILKSRGFYPFKEDSLFMLDMQDQFMEFYASLRYISGGDNSLFYSWARSLGGNYIGLYAYYLANPLSWLTILFPIRQFHTAILVLTLVKVGCCSVSFSVFASWLWKRYHAVPGKDRKGAEDFCWGQFLLVPLAVSYGLISYNIIYSSCLMWLDGVMMLPLVMLGIERILEGRKGLVYLLAYAGSCLFNYYTGYMLGLFAAIYFVFRLACLFSGKKWKYYGAAACRFAFVTLLAVGLSAPLLVPVVRDLASGKFAVTQSFGEKGTYFPFLNLFEKFTNGSYHTILPRYFGAVTMPAVYCGYVGIGLAILFFLVRRISVREKAAAGVVLAVLAMSFYLVSVNLVWHGFAFPNSFPFRQSFVMSFFVLYLAARAVCALPVEKLPTVRQRKPVLECTALLMMGIVAADMGLNGRALLYQLQNEFGYDDVDYYVSSYDKTQPLIEGIQERDQGFYRVNQGFEYSKNDAMLLGYHGMTHYSSTFNAAVNRLTRILGMAQDWFYNTGYGSTPLTDSLLGVRYILEDADVPEFYTLLDETEFGTASYINENALPVVYSAPVSETNVDFGETDPFRNQNLLLNSIAGTDEAYFTSVDFATENKGEGWSYTFTADSLEPVYLYLDTGDYSQADVLVNGETVGEYFTSETRCILYLGSFRPDQTVTVDVIPVAAVGVRNALICRLNTGLLKEALQNLKENGMEIARHKGGKLEGSIEVPEGYGIMTSIPWDAGWKVRIDGKQVQPEKYADTFMMIRTGAGTHRITFSYVSPGFGTGMAVFAAAALSGLFYFGKPGPAMKKVLTCTVFCGKSLR